MNLVPTITQIPRVHKINVKMSGGPSFPVYVPLVDRYEALDFIIKNHKNWKPSPYTFQEFLVRNGCVEGEAVAIIRTLSIDFGYGD